jgi:toluene monooxygenase electron transfer component
VRLIRLAGTDRTVPCAPGDTVLRACLRDGVGMSYSCNTGACGNCRFDLVAGEVRHLRPDPPAWSERDRARGRWLGCQAAPQGDVTVRFRPDPAAALRLRPARREGRLVAAAALSHDMAEFAFAVDGDPAFLPGQYAILSLPGVEGGRVYSMSNAPGDKVWSFVVRRVPGGAATGALFDRLRPGDRVALDGPYGLAYWREASPRPLLLLAGGSGLSPMASIARAASAAGRAPIRLYFGGRAPRDLAAAEPLAALPGVTLAAAVSDEAPGWDGRRGFIHEAAVADLGDALPAHEVYFAGPAAMAQAVRCALHAMGVPPAQIHADEFY